MRRRWAADGLDSALVRSGVVFCETSTGSPVFSVGSIAWCGGLRQAGEKTPGGRMTGNVLIRFLEDAPFAAPGRTAVSERSLD